jgi:hypothetical protein
MSTTNGKKTAPPRPDIVVSGSLAPGKPGRYIVTATVNGAEVHRDTLDLNSATARKRFVGATMRGAFKEVAPDEWPDDERERLDAELLRLARVPPGSVEPPAPAEKKTIADPRIEPLSKMPEDIRAEAERRLHSKDLLESIGDDIERLGIVGEENNRLIIYLVGTSAQLVRPLAVIVSGTSSSGKSFLCEGVSRLFPPEVVLNTTGMTTNALYYVENGTLTHRWIVAGERSRVEDDDQAEATRALREMIESGKLSKLVSVKEGDRPVSKRIEQNGPIAYSETTTLESIFSEDANRCLVLNTDESAKQTRRILAATAASASGRSSADRDRIYQVHHAIQRMLPRAKVVVPFAGAIEKHFPVERVEYRRDFRHLLQLIQASALLHFKQRDRRPDGALVASVSDYTIAETLARVPLTTAACGISEGARKFLVQLRDKFVEKEFTTTEAKQIPGIARRTVDARLNALSAQGAVEQIKASSGNVPARWRLTGAAPDTGKGMLPTVEQVMKTLSECARAHNDGSEDQ